MTDRETDAEAIRASDDDPAVDREDFQRRLDEGAGLEAQGEIEAAWKHYRALLKENKSDPALLLALARVAFARGALHKAADWLTKARRGGAAPAEVRELTTRVSAEQRSRADRVVGQGSVEQKLKLARAAWQAGDRALAEQVALSVIAAEPANAGAAEVIAWARLRDDDLPEAARAFGRLAELDPDNPRWPAQRSEALLALNDRETAIETVREALGRGSASIEIFRHVPVAALPPDLAAAAVRSARAVTPDAPEIQRKIAFSVLTQLDESVPPGLEPDYYHPDLVPDDDALLRPLVKDDGEEIIAALMEAPAPLALVFTGLADQASMPLFIFDRCLAALGVSVLYLRDKQRYGFLRGIRSLDASRDGTIERLREKIAEIAPTRLLAIGASFGGHAAVSYGAELGADAIVGFSAAINATPEFLAGDGRGRVFARKISVIPPDLLDVRNALAGAARPIPVHLAYGSDHWQDVRQAEHLASVEGVVLHPLEGLKGHGSILMLAGGGDLIPFLRRVALPEAPDPLAAAEAAA